MLFIRPACALAAAVVAFGCTTDARAGLPITYVPANGANYSHARRPASTIRLVVVHVTEGTLGSAVAWFQNPNARASAHYVVGRSGAITQMVADRQAAWHSGNGWVNRHSIGIEDEGFTGIAGTFTDTEYRASAELAATLMRRYLLPIDRRHLIGHNEVPDPVHPGMFGGFSHHTDPGRYWDWRRYLAYVRDFARGAIPPPLTFDVGIDHPMFGQRVAGSVAWSAATTGETADHVDFLVDGRVRETKQTSPSTFADGSWDSALETNGRHVLSVRAVSRDGAQAKSATVVYVKNPAIRITDITLSEGQMLSGAVALSARVTGRPLRVEFVIDGAVRDVETAAPYAFGGAAGSWDTTAEPAGAHTVTVRAIGPRERPAATRTVHVTVVHP